MTVRRGDIAAGSSAALLIVVAATNLADVRTVCGVTRTYRLERVDRLDDVAQEWTPVEDVHGWRERTRLVYGFRDLVGEPIELPHWRADGPITIEFECCRDCAGYAIFDADTADVDDECSVEVP